MKTIASIMNIKPTILILSLLVVNLFAQEAKQDLNLLRASHPHTPYDLKNIDATFTEDLSLIHI